MILSHFAPKERELREGFVGSINISRLRREASLNLTGLIFRCLQCSQQLGKF